MNDLARQFETEILDDSKEYTRITRTSPSRFVQMVAQHGCVETARRLALSKTESEGFTRAWEHKCLNLTVEHLMIFGQAGRYNSLFSEDALNAARRRLKNYGVTDALPK